MKSEMPSQTAAQIVSEEGNYQLQSTLRAALDEGRSFVKRSSRLKPASRFDIVTGTNPDEIWTRMKRNAKDRRISLTTRKSWLRKKCTLKANDVAAFATKGMIVVCFDKMQKFDQNWSDTWKFYLTRVMVHEYTHQIQIELAAALAPQYVKNKNSRSWLGPIWMIEGMAVFNEVEYVNQFRNSPVEPLGFCEESQSKGIKLSTMRINQRATDGAEYATSFLAVRALERNFGKDALYEYFEALGRGLSWERAFKETFGLALKDFERKFERARPKYGHVLSFLDE